MFLSFLNENMNRAANRICGKHYHCILQKVPIKYNIFDVVLLGILCAFIEIICQDQIINAIKQNYLFVSNYSMP